MVQAAPQVMAIAELEELLLAIKVIFMLYRL